MQQMSQPEMGLLSKFEPILKRFHTTIRGVWILRLQAAELFQWGTIELPGTFGASILYS